MNEKVWGKDEGFCAWCNAPATTNYAGEVPTGEAVDYQVCPPCRKEFA